MRTHKSDSAVMTGRTVGHVQKVAIYKCDLLCRYRAGKLHQTGCACCMEISRELVTANRAQRSCCEEGANGWQLPPPSCDFTVVSWADRCNQ